MKIATISDARRFSLESVQYRELGTVPGLAAELICFEAGQVAAARTNAGATSYQVLEGEAMVRAGGETSRLGKGRLASVEGGTEHTIENAGGGLLVVLAISAS